MDHLLSSLFGKKEGDPRLPQREHMKRVYLGRVRGGIPLSSVGDLHQFFVSEQPTASVPLSQDHPEA